ncbi:MAG: FKBP-type peptidyl-prolyl cis-trans isomerase [Gemmatimonadota bacterium]|nr:MAG: FKBP-type peptidyl-prolyl cis-trans isomerase [Gemmatimonadota bacterium]
MRIRYRSTALIAGLALAGCQGSGPNAANASLESDDEIISYAFGHQIALQLSAWKSHLEMSALLAGMEDGLAKLDSRLDDSVLQEARARVGALVQAEQARLTAETAAKNLEEGTAFLVENAQREGVVTLDSGLQYEIITEGEGARPTVEDQVSVHYKGTLIDGTEFDSSYQRGQPATFAVTGVIAGFTEALMLMNVGSNYRFFIPSALAYGETGGGPIGPNTVLIFEMELLEIL